MNVFFMFLFNKIPGQAGDDKLYVMARGAGHLYQWTMTDTDGSSTSENWAAPL